ncbi:Hypothetical predicted protein [Pelobates cultripes]|uniref:Uncharacterized protein n=1 Tax=Pelobates cultripes TaxID=61616 RepID=A0AAD1SUM1_PELCU|nr:Hypothetical predicted protein [Pelobates cultripes]
MHTARLEQCLWCSHTEAEYLVPVPDRASCRRRKHHHKKVLADPGRRLGLAPRKKERKPSRSFVEAPLWLQNKQRTIPTRPKAGPKHKSEVLWGTTKNTEDPTYLPASWCSALRYGSSKQDCALPFRCIY